MGITVDKVAELLHGKLSDRVSRRTHCKRYQNFVCMQARIMVAHVIDLHVLYRLDNVWRYKRNIVGNSRKNLKGIEKRCRSRSEKVGCLSCHNLTRRKLKSNCRAACRFCADKRSSYNMPVRNIYAALLHQKLNLRNIASVRISLADLRTGIIVTSDNLLA